MPHDVFVSYAHADDVPPSVAPMGLVSTFVEELKRALRWKLGGCGADVWKDYFLAMNDRVEETLAERVRSSRTIVLFMSEGYLRSRWCQQEINEFLRAHRPERAESVFVVAIDETDRTRWPERVRELTPLELFTKSEAGVIERLGFPNPPKDGGLYWTRLNELAHFLCRYLRSRESSEATVNATPAPVTVRSQDAPHAGSVWIAQPARDLQEQWESLASAIRQHGITVRPAGHSTYVANDLVAFRESVERDMTGSRMLVQLLSAEPGSRGPTGASALSIQASAARLYAQTYGTPYLRWRPADLRVESIDDVEHRDLLRGTIASGFEAFRQQVLDSLTQAPQPPLSRDAPADKSDGSLSVCVTAGPKDRDLSDAVANVIEGMGHAAVAVPPAPEGSQTQATYREQIEALLREVNGVIVVHGQEDGLWVTSRHFQVRKILAPKRKGLWGAYLNGPPPNKARVRIADPGVMALDCRDGVKPEPIRDFIHALGGQ